MNNNFNATAFALAEENNKKSQEMMQRYKNTGDPVYLDLAEKYADAYNYHSFYGERFFDILTF